MIDLSRFSLKEKVALVTGGSRGIGKAAALGFAQAGADVAIVSRNLPDLERAAEEIKGLGRRALAVEVHAGRLTEIDALVETVVSEFGKIDILVNNAGTNPIRASILETEERLWDSVVNLNLKGAYFLSRAVARVMKRQGGGNIINIASINGYVPSFGVGVYSITKAALIMATKSMALELAEHNIRVNAIAPGIVNTRLFESRWFNASEAEKEKQKAQQAGVVPLRRIAAPEDMVGALIYLASDSASYTTGETILIDGGMLLKQAREILED